MRYIFNAKEEKAILKKLVMLVDTREQANIHIIEFFTKNKIAWQPLKLEYGDYSCYLPLGSFEGQQRDIYFTDDIVIERKFCIDEIAMNFRDNITNINQINQEIIDLLGKEYLAKVLKTDYNRFKSELAGINKYGIKFFIFIEDKKYDENIRLGNFRAKYEPKTLYKRVKALESEFNTMLRPTDESMMGSEIYNTLYYGVRNVLIKKGLIEGVDNEKR